MRIKRLSKVKYQAIQAQMNLEAAQIFCCMHKLLIERHGWDPKELGKEINRLLDIEDEENTRTFEGKLRQ